MEVKERLKTLCDAFGVVGAEDEAMQVAKDLLAPLCDSVEIDRFGNLIGRKSCGRPGAPRLMLDAHIDQIGFLVTEVAPGGFLRFMDIGVDQRMLIGSELTILPQSGGEYLGVVASTPPHLQTAGSASAAPAVSDMVVDTGMTDERARQIFRVGDYMMFRGGMFGLLGDQVCGKAFDDRACFMCIVRALELLGDRPFGCDLVISGSTKEEIGLQGAGLAAYATEPDFAVALDVTHATTPDAAGGDNTYPAGKGPVISIGTQSNPRMARRMIELAREKSIPYLTDAVPMESGTNASSIQLTGCGIPTVVLSLPLKYMHTPAEVIRLGDLEKTAELLAEFIAAFSGLYEEVRGNV